MPKNVLVLHGPNLNLLGERPGDAPELTLDSLTRQLKQRAKALGLELRFFQSNHEGALIDRLHAERRWAEAVVLNPGALAHSSYALREALAAVGKPAVEVHLDDLRKGPVWRRKSVLKDVCAAQVMGKGLDSYFDALERCATGEWKKRAARARKPAAAKTKAAPKGKGKASKATAATPAVVAQVRPPPRTKTLGRVPVSGSGASATVVKLHGSPVRSGNGVHPLPMKTLARAPAVPATPRGGGAITRAQVRQKIAERLGGKLTPAGLATWARTQWLEVQRGAPAESGQRELLEDTLQSLTLSAVPASRLSEDQLVELMTQLEG